MFTCRQVAKTLDNQDYADLPRWKRLSLRLHVLLCLVCGRYHRYVMRFQDGVREYRKGEAARKAPPADDGLSLRSEERESIRRVLASRSD